MASAEFFVADPDRLPPPAARRAAQDFMRTATSRHWTARTSDTPEWAGATPTCPQCNVYVGAEQPVCPRCQQAVDPAGFSGGYARFRIWLFDDPEPAAVEHLRAGLQEAVGSPVRASRKVPWYE